MNTLGVMKAERKSNVAKQPSAYPYSVRDRKPSKRAEAAKEQEDARVLPQKQHAWPDRASRAGKRKASSTLREIRATSPAARYVALTNLTFCSLLPIFAFCLLKRLLGS